MFHKPRLCVICESIRPVKHIAPTSLPLLGAKIMTNHLNFPKDKSKSLKTICILTKRMKFSKKRMYLVHIPISLRFLFCNRRRRSVNPPLCLWICGGPPWFASGAIGPPLGVCFGPPIVKRSPRFPFNRQCLYRCPLTMSLQLYHPYKLRTLVIR